MNNRHFLVLLLLILCGVLQANDRQVFIAQRLDDFESQLDQLHRQCALQDSTQIPLYYEVKTRIHNLRELNQIRAKISDQEVDIIDILLAAAGYELETAAHRRDLTVTDQQIVLADVQIDSLTRAIDQVRRSHIVALRDSVDREQAVSARLREESEDTKELLALQQEESERVRQQLSKQREEAERQLDELQNGPVEVSRTSRGTIVSVPDAWFDTKHGAMKPELQNLLAKIAGILLVYRQPNVTITGYMTETGSEASNRRLSQDRAESVRRYLIAQGVDPVRLSAVGYGSGTIPGTDTTATEHARNRRVDLIIEDSGQ